MKYAFVDTDSGTATPGTKVHNSATFPATSDCFNTLTNLLADATVQAVTEDLEIYCRGATDDGGVTVSTSLLAASVKVIGNIAGAAWDASKYTISVTGATGACMTMTYAIGNFTLRGVQMSITGSASTPRGYTTSATLGAVTITLEGNHVRIGGSGTSTGQAIRVAPTATGTSCVIRNNICQQLASPGGRRDGIVASVSNMTAKIYNNVVTGFDQASAVGITAASDTLKNNAVWNNTDDISGTSLTVDYCASDDGDGSHAVTGLTWANEFEDITNGDFRLKSGSVLRNAGIGPGSDADVPSTDIAGTTRAGATTDIGAWQHASAGQPFSGPFGKFFRGRL